MKPTAIAIFKVSAPIVVFATAFLALGTYLTRERCIILPDGSMIGYRAILLTHRDDGLNIVLKRPGSTLIADSSGLQRLMKDPKQPDNILLVNIVSIPGADFVDALALGFVTKAWQQRGDPDRTDYGLVGTNLIHDRLLNSGKYPAGSCPTPLFALHKPD
ncbi:hypothetical protein FJU08_06715 [Martelella alba]|uniref:Uncharacterized protein n=1 Tax=Martelella alba TaxID=2590451 RepID=A0A506UCX1_9HYPH|nr:hypothetical protein [Martelella alba]TPW31448.1 hypothetical protein FJU08_06715 [Martelella alba]